MFWFGALRAEQDKFSGFSCEASATAGSKKLDQLTTLNLVYNLKWQLQNGKP